MSGQRGEHDQVAVIAALDHIVASGSLGSSSRLIPLLRYVVTEELEGRGDRIKAYSIATDVFSRGADFDSISDSIVRVEFRRLRQALEHYYATKGSQAAVRIEIPVGNYRPVFKDAWQKSAAGAPSGAVESVKAKGALSWFRSHGIKQNSLTVVALLVAAIGGAGLFYANLLHSGSGQFIIFHSGSEQISKQADSRRIVLVVPPVSTNEADRPLAAYAIGLREQVLAASSKQQIYLTTGNPQGVDEEENVDNLFYSLLINVQKRATGVRVTASLDDESGIRLWGETFFQPMEHGLPLQDDIANQLIRDLRPHVVGAAKREIASAKGMMVERDVWKLYVSAAFLENEFADDLQAEQIRIALARQAVELNPRFGQAHAVLAQMLAHLTNVDLPSDTAPLRKEAEEHALAVLKTAARDADALYNLGFYYWSIGQMNEAELMGKRALDLDPNHLPALSLVEVARYTCNKPPRGPIERLRKLDKSLSTDNPARWLLLLALSQLSVNSDNMMAAEEYARMANVMHRGVESVYLFAAILNRRGQPEAARDLVARLRNEWPNIDLKHYAEVVIPRRCPAGTRAVELHALYQELADAQLVTSTVHE